MFEGQLRTWAASLEDWSLIPNVQLPADMDGDIGSVYHLLPAWEMAQTLQGDCGVEFREQDLLTAKVERVGGKRRWEIM